MKIVHYDLFAGIGGFSLALDTIFNEYERQHIFCEWEAFPTAVLRKHWPDGTYYGDIADLVTDTKSAGTGEDISGLRGLSERYNQRQQRQGDITIVTGGFPCQPFSHAGRRKGTADDRYQWPNMFQVIQNVRPDWVIAENVRGLVTWNEGMVLETVCADLESEGYEVQPIIIPAVAIGAPHRRDRVWIVAHTKDADGRGELRNIFSEDAKKLEPKEQHEDESRELSDASWDATHTINNGQGGEKRTVSTTSNSVPQEYRTEDSTTGEFERADSDRNNYGFTWQDDWREVAFASCDGSLDDGLPRDMAGLTISYAKYRRESLKSVGNSIVPQVAMQIFEAIKYANKKI